MTGRLSCCVPFCRRTTQAPNAEGRLVPTEWICNGHWKAIPRSARRAYGRRLRRLFRHHLATDRAAADRLWAWLKRKAIEAAAGI
jgi:hypothetical protein